MAAVETSEHLDPTAELSLETIKNRAVKGVATLTGRTFLLQIISLLAFGFFGALLTEVEWGVWILLSAVVNFFAYFSDVGLAAALIQKKERVTEEELRTTFTVQQVLVIALLILIFALTPLFRQWYELSSEAVFLLWAVTISFFLSSLKTIPTVLLERHLEFNKLVIPQIVETMLFNTVAVYLVWKGFGITSFTIAVLVRGFSGLILIYILQPWVPGFTFSRVALRGLLRFGLPYQANTFLAVVKDDGVTVVLGGILGLGGVGLIGWAQKWAFAPLRFFMDQVIKVTFPAFSRMQENKDELSRAVSRSIFFICLLVFPSLVGLVLVAPPLTEIIPRYERWQPALLALGLYSINSAWAAVTTPLTNLLNAIGKITITFRLMIMWTTLTWILFIPLALVARVNGAAVGAAIVGTSSIVAIFVARRHVNFELLESVGKPFIASCIMGAVVFLLRSIVPVSVLWILLLVAIGITVYVSAILVLVGPSLIVDTKKIWNEIRKH